MFLQRRRNYLQISDSHLADVDEPQAAREPVRLILVAPKLSFLVQGLRRIRQTIQLSGAAPNTRRMPMTVILSDLQSRSVKAFVGETSCDACIMGMPAWSEEPLGYHCQVAKASAWLGMRDLKMMYAGFCLPFPIYSFCLFAYSRQIVQRDCLSVDGRAGDAFFFFLRLRPFLFRKVLNIPHLFALLFVAIFLNSLFAKSPRVR